MNTLRKVNFMPGVGDAYLPLLVTQACARQYCSGAVCGVVKGNEVITFPAGFHSSCGSGAKAVVSDGSLFDVASVTKSIPIALLVLWAITEGYISLNSDVRSFFPKLQVNHGENPTIRDLLSYACRFDLDYIESPYTGYGDREALMDIILSANVTVRHTMFYGNYPPILLGLILEKVTGKTIQQLSQDVIFGPLGMTSSTFSPPDDEILVVQTEIDPVTQKTSCGKVHDELTSALGRPGSAGLFASTIDLLRVMRFMLDEGAIGTKQIIAPELIRQIGINQFKQGGGFGLGFGLWPVFANGFDDDGVDLCGLDPNMLKGAFFKNGYTGCTVFAFPKLDLGMVINTNHVHPVRRNSSLWINRFRYTLAVTAVTGVVPRSAKLLWDDRVS
jgi:CubicO group peptidase (beta-lactamase class C family)